MIWAKESLAGEGNTQKAPKPEWQWDFICRSPTTFSPYMSIKDYTFSEKGIFISSF